MMCLSNRKPLSRGFSLIELLVVMAIVGTLVGFVAPYTMQTLDKSQARGELMELEQIIKSWHLDAFYMGGRVVIELQDNNLITLLPNGQETVQAFEFLNFPEQTIYLSSVPYPRQIEIDVYSSNDLRTLVLTL